jgi:hypothetical protein
MTKTTLTMVRLPKDIIRQHNLNSILKSGLLDEAGIQVEFPRTLRRGYCGGPCVSLGAFGDAEMLAKLDVFGSSQLELAVWVADPVLSVLVLVCC